LYTGKLYMKGFPVLLLLVFLKYFFCLREKINCWRIHRHRHFHQFHLDSCLYMHDYVIITLIES